MKLFPNYMNDDGTRSWRGRHQHYLVVITEVFNKELGYVDKYKYQIKKSMVNYYYQSLSNFDTVESCKNDALQTIEEHKAILRQLSYPRFKGGDVNVKNVRR